MAFCMHIDLYRYPDSGVSAAAPSLGPPRMYLPVDQKRRISAEDRGRPRPRLFPKARLARLLEFHSHSPPQAKVHESTSHFQLRFQIHFPIIFGSRIVITFGLLEYNSTWYAILVIEPQTDQIRYCIHLLCCWFQRRCNYPGHLRTYHNTSNAIQYRTVASLRSYYSKPRCQCRLPQLNQCQSRHS